MAHHQEEVRKLQEAKAALETKILAEQELVECRQREQAEAQAILDKLAKEDLSEAATNVRVMIQSVGADPFIQEDERTTRVDQLRTMLHTLQRAFNPQDLSPKERLEFAQQLEAGWTTDLEYELIEVLLS